MLTLDQVRTVNDGLKSGDMHAALRPLEETIDLRHAEMPRLDKSAVTALKSGLQTPGKSGLKRPSIPMCRCGASSAKPSLV